MLFAAYFFKPTQYWHGMLHALPAGGPARLSRPATVFWLLAVALAGVVTALGLARMPSLPAKPCCWLGGGVYFSGLIASRLLVGRGSWAFRASSLAMIGFWVAVAASLFPDILISADRPEWSISIRQAAAPASSLCVVMVASPVLMVVIACYRYFIQRMIRRAGEK